MKKVREGAKFTHFGSIPFIRNQYRQSLHQLQQKITDIFKERGFSETLKLNNPNLFHLTLSMLTLPHQSMRTKMQQVLDKHKEELSGIMNNTILTTQKIRYFTFKKGLNGNKKGNPNVSVIYLDLKKDEQFEKINKLVDVYIRLLLKQQLIFSEELKDMYIQLDQNKNMFKNQDPHITLFRCENLEQSPQFLQCFAKIENLYQNHILKCDSIDISTRFEYDVTKFYNPLYRIDLGDKPGQKQDKKEEQ